MENYYEILGVQTTATAEEIKKRYRELAKEFHPDKNSSKEAEEMFKKINAAHETLSDTQKRQQFDYAWRQRQHANNTYSFNQKNPSVWSPIAVFLTLLAIILLAYSVLRLNNKKAPASS